MGKLTIELYSYQFPFFSLTAHRVVDSILRVVLEAAALGRTRLILDSALYIVCIC